MPGLKEQQTNTAGSLPQGSPVSPILFLLFLTPLLKELLPNQNSLPRRGYADDILISASCKSPEGTSTALEQDFARCRSWCGENGLNIDPDKCGLIHFRRHNQGSEVGVHGGRGIGLIKPVPKGQTLK